MRWGWGRPGNLRFGALALFALLASPAAAAQGQAPGAEQLWKDAHQHSQAYSLLRELTGRIGPRLTGSDKGRQAETWALRRFRAAGYANARFAPFTLQRWIRGPVSLQVAGVAVPALAFGGSPARASLSSEIVEMGNGIDAEYQAAPDKVRGKIALIYYTVLPDSPDSTPFLARWEKIRLAIRYGAKAVVFINRGQGNDLSVRQAWLDGPLPIPVLMIGHDRGMAIRARLQGKPAQAALEMRNRVGKAVARNIVATLPGTDPKAEHIVFGAHLDSWDLATGALDNGAGAVSVLEIARLFRERGYRPRRTIEFILYMGEEQGELGSTALLRQQIADRSADNIGYVVNSDMSYDPVALNTWGMDTGTHFFPALVAELKALDAGFSSDIMNRPMPGGDPQAYAEKGFPVLFIAGAPGPDFMRCQHAACDRLNIIRPEPLDRLVAVSAITLLRLANAEKLPAERIRGKALEDYIERNGLRM
ncbi:MAG: M20/M25/M40 family metallo-hydrolase [Sphingomonas sp.]